MKEIIIRNVHVNIIDLLDKLYNDYIKTLDDVYENGSTTECIDVYDDVVLQISLLEKINLLTFDEAANICVLAYDIMEMYQRGTRVELE